eukprot:Blabericola_migrator_1__5940@NODE_2_length_32877_cov_165_790003_g1_i0_p11_GENE_NODE_2_length_32877_cov_165_790003_g1_i0NODE_2_length_32877_cov_165_790003_g1_i0_p11_ORF_typecomplete_len467_score71_20Defensin_1/PF00323_19/7_4e02Defensin_1/PF00323_19/0_057Defensin_1/PF00323_19/8_5e03_NODE_2_length_32877_cov_165_790003_g1_i01801819418
MLPLRLIALFALPAILCSGQDFVTGQKKKEYIVNPYTYNPAPVPGPISYPDKFKKATPYDVSEPIYTCPKSGYVLDGEDCIFIDTVPARFECPIGYNPEGGSPGLPSICRRIQPAVTVCPRGILVNGACRVSEYSDATLVCPSGTERSPDGLCVRYEAVSQIERCPVNTNRIQGQCVEISYHEPVYVCPPDTAQDGRKCRREIVTFKEKHRKLGEENELDGAATLRAQTQIDEFDPQDLFVDLPEHIFQSDNVPLGNELQGIKSDPTWLPAYYPEPYIGKYEKVEKVKTVKVKEPKEPKIKEVKIKVPKAPPPPQQIIKVQYLPADKVCEIGERHGGSCIIQTVTPPVIECPVPLINGSCSRRLVAPPVATCPDGTDLVCPPSIPGHRCRCETIIQVAPTPQCPVGTLNPSDNTCVSTAPPKAYCPLGYFLDANGTTCTKRDVEAALCLFQVTYMCPDCDREFKHK